MNRILLILGLAIPFISQGQNTIPPGNWREVRRADLNNRVMEFSDTIKIAFLTGGEYTWHKKNGFVYRGTYKIEKGNMDMGARSFRIVSQGQDRLVLQDDGAIYEFHPYTEPARSKLAVERPPLPVTSVAQMTGKWSVFKRTSDKTQKDIDYTRLVESVMIYDSPDPDGSIGYVAAAKDPDNTHSWKIRRFEGGVLYCDGRDVRAFRVIKAEKELILEEEGTTYFFKKFR